MVSVVSRRGLIVMLFDFTTNCEWKNYMGLPYEEVKNSVAQICKNKNFSGKMLDVKRSKLLSSGDAGFVLELVLPVRCNIFIQKARYDPLNSIFLSFVSDKSKFDSICYVTVVPFNRDNINSVATFFMELSKMFNKQIYDIKDHPKMKHAWIMRAVVKRRWKKLFQALPEDAKVV